MRRGNLRDEGYDPDLFQKTKLGMQRSFILETIWVLLCTAMTICCAVGQRQVEAKYWGFIGQYMASILAFYAISVVLLGGIHRRPLRVTLHYKGIKKVVRPIVFLIAAICMAFAYDALHFYNDVLQDRFFVIEITGLLIYPYLAVYSLLGLAVVLVFILSILTCQINICAFGCCKCRSRSLRQELDELNELDEAQRRERDERRTRRRESRLQQR